MTPDASRPLAFARLVRLPNVFTALADVGLGMFVAGPHVVGWGPAAFLLLSSACLYCGGMVWNDYFDIEQDRRERPFRPLPSGVVTLGEAWRLGVGLLAAGMVAAAAAGLFAATLQPVAIAAALTGAILLYDRWLKRTWAGPVGMGACRFLNVLLGLSTVPAAAVPWAARLHLAAVVGVYVIGVTWFARTEATGSNPVALRRATGVMAAGLGLALLWPLRWPDGSASPLFVYLLAALALVVGLPAVRACESPTPSRVQRAVKQAVLGLVGLDAVLATAAAGTVGLVLLLFLPPAVALGRRVYST